MNLSKRFQIPKVGFGTYLISDEDVSSCVYNAICSGYRHIDTAEVYENEKGVGRGIRDALKDLNLTRDNIFVTTKLWPGNEIWDEELKTFETSIQALNSSLNKLKLDYVDLYLIHGPFAKKQRLEQWRALLELNRLGKTRAVGVSNYNVHHIQEIKSSGMQLPVANQLEIHPWSQKPTLIKFLNKNGISVIAYSSLVPLPNWRNNLDQSSSKTEEMESISNSKNSPFEILSKKYGVSQAQILLRWAIQKGYPIIPKSTVFKEIKQNIDLFSFKIDQSDMSSISMMDKGDGVAWTTGDPIKIP